MSRSAKFIINDEGERKVILPADEYEQLLEDMADLVVIAERSDEPTSSYEEVVAKLKSDGLF
jgi:hypothetical protein